ncbi:hypothetical protein [Halosimplex halobium]|uniref:hypothetical protein n=1 Tax=Halosimplex halobium TaxID=3396618 RepID=UPI003F5622D3
MTSPSDSLSRGDTTVVPDGGNPDDLGRKRHRILRELRRELERHPAVARATGTPDRRYRELRATLDTAILGVDANEATLRVTWWPEPDEPEYAFHYSEDTGFDCGWHREPNPHVEGKLHYQERASPEDSYEYESVSFQADTPPRVLWTVLDRLTDRL